MARRAVWSYSGPDTPGLHLAVHPDLESAPTLLSQGWPASARLRPARPAVGRPPQGAPPAPRHPGRPGALPAQVRSMARRDGGYACCLRSWSGFSLRLVPVSPRQRVGFGDPGPCGTDRNTYMIGLVIARASRHRASDGGPRPESVVRWLPWLANRPRECGKTRRRDQASPRTWPAVHPKQLPSASCCAGIASPPG